MAQNSGCLYGVAPDAYMSYGNDKHNHTHKWNKEGGMFKHATRPGRSKRRHYSFDKNFNTVSYFFKKRDLRIQTIGKHHVVYQIASRHGDFGPERTAKIIRKHKKVYFEIKNQKYYLKRANIVW